MLSIKFAPHLLVEKPYYITSQACDYHTDRKLLTSIEYNFSPSESLVSLGRWALGPRPRVVTEWSMIVISKHNLFKKGFLNYI